MATGDRVPRRRRGRRAVARDEVVERRAGPPPERHWWIWLLLLLLLVVAGLIVWWLLTRGDDKTKVPRVIGMQETAAVQKLERSDLKALPDTGASNRPVGEVFAQRPGAGAQVDEGQTVTISVSGGPARKPVPNVTNLQLAQAQQQLKAAGFESAVKRVASSRPKGTVTEQAPVAGVTAVKGTTVQLSVSSGAKPVVVPSVVGMTQGQAVAQLTRAGLKATLQNVPSARPAGQVVAQKPAAGKEVDKGSKVVLNISRGSGGGTTTVQTTTTTATTVTTTTATRVPSVSSLAVTAGLRRLNTAGFRPIVRYVNSSQTAGRIITQSPASGTARRGSPVRIAVSNGPNPAAPEPVPDVVGQDQAAAATALRQAGFRPVVLFRRTTDQTQVGQVIEQQPVAGRNIPRGSYVAIFVGHSA